MRLVLVVSLTFALWGFTSCGPKWSEDKPYPAVSKFKFGDKVKVINGFYVGLTGKVVEETKNYSTACNLGYLIRFSNETMSRQLYFCHADLEKQ